MFGTEITDRIREIVQGSQVDLNLRLDRVVELLEEQNSLLRSVLAQRPLEHAPRLPDLEIDDL